MAKLDGPEPTREVQGRFPVAVGLYAMHHAHYLCMTSRSSAESMIGHDRSFPSLGSGERQRERGNLVSGLQGHNFGYFQKYPGPPLVIDI
ncbi:hypothetical protein N7523_009376 [Penicillium sp. IBT 18751x]|nr:hypothetical protein N7523_009376 [Penicillium sp. IBT 18751x]